MKAFSALDSNCGGPVPKLYIGGGQSAPSSSHDPTVVQARIIACRMLGKFLLMLYWITSTLLFCCFSCLFIHD